MIQRHSALPSLISSTNYKWLDKNTYLDILYIRHQSMAGTNGST